MTIIGQVVYTAGKTAKVRTARPQACEHCSSATFCKAYSKIEITAYNEIGAQEGDYVSVETTQDKKSLLLLCFLFLTPIGILFLSAGLYTLIPAAAVAGIPLFGLYLVLLKQIDKHYKSSAIIQALALPPKDCGQEDIQN